MARYSSQLITSIDQDWNFDPIEQLPFSGAAVQKFIKSYLGAVAKASHFDSNTNTMYWFASESDKEAYIDDPSLNKLVLFKTTMSFASELFRIALNNNTGATNLNVATNQTDVVLDIDFDVQTKSMTESAWRSTGKGVYISVQVDAGAYGDYETIMPPTFYAAETNFSLNVRNDIVVGTNRVKVNFVAERDDTVVAGGDDSVITSITYTIVMTEMFIEPMNNEWFVPIVETGDAAYYKIGGFRIIGAVNKTLHVDIYNGSNKLLTFEKNIGTTAYDRVPYNFTKSEGLDLSDLPSGVYLVSAYLTSGSLITAPVNYNIIYIAQGDETTAQFVAINEAADVVYNYTTSTLFKYTVYNKGTLTASPAVVVKQITGTTPTTIVDTVINDVSTGAQHSYEVALEWLTEETLNLYVQGEITFGNQQIARASLDNSATFPPTYGYEFYLNAASRSNADTNRLKIVNAVNNQEYTPTWENMVWIDGVDGWTVDDTDRQCLYLPAGSKMTLPYGQYKLLNGENITIEMCYRIANVTDYDEIAISIMDNLESLGFTGVRIKPTNITVHSSQDTSDVNDLVRGTNLLDEQVVHFVLTVYPNFSGNNNKNLVTGYINGCKNFQFEYNTGAVWNTNANLKMGCERSDISLYFIRVYRSVLSDAAVLANYINSQKGIAARTELAVLLKSCMDASQSFIDFESVKNNDYNFFIIEMIGVDVTVPSRANNWSKDTPAVRSNLEMHFGKHPDWDWRIENVETAGQGTTSMNYFRWNLRWRIDKTKTPINKQVPVQYLESRVQNHGSYQYNWHEASNQKTLKFDGTLHPKVMRITAKINAASSMQDHKIGATKAYTELHDEIELVNEAQEYAIDNSLPKPTVSVYQYPAFGFEKRGDTYQFIGLFTIGPDKGDKPTFGFDISNDIKSELISIEGTDHDRYMVRFNYPWNDDVQYLFGNECLNIVKGVNDYDNGWEVGNCHEYSTDSSDHQAAIQTVLETELKPAYNVAYENSTLILGIPLGEYGATAQATLDYINANIATFQSQLDDNNRMIYANYQFWIEGEYVLYYYDIKTNQYVANQDLVTQHGMPSGSTVAEQNEWFKEQRRIAFKASAEDYWDIQDTLFHMAFVIIFGAMDNFGKNTYPYKMATLANGGRWKWRQDDLDSIFGIGNAGTDNMPSWMEFQDSDNGTVYFGGSTSVFWNLIYECYYDNYVSTIDNVTREGLIATGKNIMTAMASLGGGSNIYDGVINYIKTRFWANAQNYFPQSAYNADAKFKYEDAWIAGGAAVNTVPPLIQSLGNHYLAEQYWVRKRMIYVMSLFKVGAFGNYSDASLGQISFRSQSLPLMTVSPYTMLYPVFTDGQGIAATARTEGGEPFTFIGPFGAQGQTDQHINASDYLVDIGDWKDMRLSGQYLTNGVTIQGKKLIKFKIGDAEEAVTTNVPSLSFDNTYCLEEIDARNAASLTQTLDLTVCRRLRRAFLEGTNLTQVRLKSGSKIEVLHLSDSMEVVSLRNLRKLAEQNLQLPSDLSKITTVQIERCDFDVLQILYSIYSTEGSKLKYFNVAMYQNKTVPATYLEFLVNIVNGLDKDGNPTENGYHGIGADGQVQDGANPTIDGTLILSDGYYEEDMDALQLTNVEPYTPDPTKNIGLAPFFSALYVVYDPNVQYIYFVDASVRDVCIANFSTDGIGVTVADARNRNCNSLFRNNTNIETFDEFEYFTGVTNMQFMFSGSSIKKVTLPDGIRLTNDSAKHGLVFYNATSLQELDLGDTVRLQEASNTQLQLFTNCSSLTKLHYSSVEQIIQFSKEQLQPSDTPFGYNNSTHYVYIGDEEVRNIVIPSTITNIRSASFYRFNRILSVDIPSTVTTIGTVAFQQCSLLATVIVRATTPPSLSNANAFNNNASDRKFYVPYSADHSVLDAYKAATNWSTYASSIYELDENGNIPS